MNKFLSNLINSPSEENFIEIVDNIYQNKLFNISFEIPQGWHVVQLEKFNEIARKQKFKDSAEFLKEYLYDSIGFPCCIITKYDPDSDLYDGIVSPTINFSISPRENEEPNISLKEYALLLDIDEDESILNNFRVLEVGDVFQHAGYNHVYVETEYLFEHPELESPVMVEMTVLNVEYGDFFLDFSMTQCKSQGEIADVEFKLFFDSIMLGR